jgi:hypothetical protein
MLWAGVVSGPKLRAFECGSAATALMGNAYSAHFAMYATRDRRNHVCAHPDEKLFDTLEARFRARPPMSAARRARP